jgi:hypothetical protein
MWSAYVLVYMHTSAYVVGEVAYRVGAVEERHH